MQTDDKDIQKYYGTEKPVKFKPRAAKSVKARIAEHAREQLKSSRAT